MNIQFQRQQRINKIKDSLSKISILSKNSTKIEAKEEKIRTRKQSLQYAVDAMHSQKLMRKFSDQDQEQERNNLNTFLQKYRIISKIGEGANAIVHTCQYMKTNKIYAVKKITMQPQHILQLKRNFINIKNLRHPSIIKYHALYFDLNKHLAYLIMEYFPFENLNDQNIKDESELRIIFEELLGAISYIHQRNICHRDIKPQNILYDPATRRVKLIDFGISKRTFLRGERRDMYTIIGTSLYLAPEILNGGGYDEKIDLWSLGITLYRLLTGRTPFQSLYVADTIASIRKGNIVYDKDWDKFSFFVKDFTMRLLKPKEQRLSAKQALRHLWITQNSPTRDRKNSQPFEQARLTRRDSFNLRVFQSYTEQQSLNLKNAKSKQEGDQKLLQLPKKIYKLNLIQNKEFDLEDSCSSGDDSPSTAKSSKSWQLQVLKRHECCSAE